MGVKLKKRVNRSGTTSLYLEIYHSGNRYYEFLDELKLKKPLSPSDRIYNKNCLEWAKQIEINRAKEIIEKGYDLKSNEGRLTGVISWMQDYINNYRKKDIRNLQGALNKFSVFVKEEENRNDLFFRELNEQFVIDYQDYLRNICKGEGSSSYFSRFKKMLRVAYREGLLSKDIASQVKTISGTPRPKDVLTIAELDILSKTEITNSEIKRAFLFSCMTGLRWVDIKSLNWAHINVGQNMIIKSQEKTEKVVKISINQTAKNILEDSKVKNGLIFKLPTADGANKVLKNWVKKAGISKNITWHNARHTFGTLLISNGTDHITTASLLGHTSLKYIMTYVKIANDQKIKATENINLSGQK